MPNAASCPSTAAASLSQPLSTAQGAAARQVLPQRPPIQNDAALGTGTGCPPVAPDASNETAAKVQLGPGRGADIAHAGALSGPAANP